MNMKKCLAICVVFFLVASVFGVAAGSVKSEEQIEAGKEKSVEDSDDLELQDLADSLWPSFGRDRKNTALSPYDTSHVDGTEKWRYSTGIVVSSSPSVSDNGTIYVGSYDNNLYAIDSEEEIEKWRFETYGRIQSTPTIGEDETIYVGSNDNNLYAVNSNGVQEWSFETDNPIISSPAIDEDGTVYIGSNDNNLYAVRPDGTEKWSFETGDSVASSPTIGEDGTVYVGSEDNKLYAINSDGTEKWSFETGDSVTSSPTIGEDGTIYGGSFDHHLYAINPDGTEKWNFKTDSWIRSSPIIAEDGTIYIGSNDCNLYAINPDGTEKWRFKKQIGNVYSSPAIGEDGTIYVGSVGPYLHAVNPEDGTEKWNYTTGTIAYTSPTMGGDGTIYVGSWSANLIALNPDGTARWIQEGGVVSLPVIDNQGTIYVGSNDYNLYAINSNGTKKWSFNVGGPVYSSPAIGVDGTIYVASSFPDNNLYAINPDGSEKWRFPISFRSSSLAIGEDGTIYFGSDEGDSGGALYAVNPDGTEKWRFETDCSMHRSTPAIGEDGTIYAGSDYPESYLFAINPDGTEKWRFSINTGGSSPAVGEDGTIYVGSWDNSLYAINPDGTEKWSFETNDEVHSSPAIGADGTIYVGSHDNNLYAISPDGTEKWSFETEGSVDSSLVVGDDGAIYMGSSLNLYAVNPDGTEKWSFETNDLVGESSVIGEDGTIYIGSFDGNLYAIGDEPQEHTLTIEEPVGEGTVEVDDQEVTKWPYEEEYAHGTEVELEAVSDEGWYFDEWTGTDKTGEEITIMIEENKTITAHFEEDTTEPEGDFSIEWNNNSTYEPTIRLRKETNVTFNGTEIIAHPEYDGELEFCWTLIDEDAKETLAESEEAFWTYDDFIEAGEYTIRLNVSDEAENYRVIEKTIIIERGPVPDLMVHDLEFSEEDVRVGDTITISVGVTNIGDLKAEDIDTRLTVNGEPVTIEERFYQDGEELEIPKIGEGETVTIRFEWEPEDSGEKTVNVNVTDAEEPKDLWLDNDIEDTIYVEEEMLEEYDLTINIEGQGSTVPSEGTHTYQGGKVVTVEAIPGERWAFDEWTGDYEGKDKEITIEMDEDKEVIAHFETEIDLDEWFEEMEDYLRELRKPWKVSPSDLAENHADRLEEYVKHSIYPGVEDIAPEPARILLDIFDAVEESFDILAEAEYAVDLTHFRGELINLYDDDLEQYYDEIEKDPLDDGIEGEYTHILPLYNRIIDSLNSYNEGGNGEALNSIKEEAEVMVKILTFEWGGFNVPDISSAGTKDEEFNDNLLLFRESLNLLLEVTETEIRLGEINAELREDGYDIKHEDQGIAYSDESYEKSFYAEAGEKIKVMLSWPGSTMKLSIYEPDGSLYEEVESDNPPVSITIEDAEKGIYEYSVEAIDVSEDGAPYAVSIGSLEEDEDEMDWLPYLGIGIIALIVLVLVVILIKKRGKSKPSREEEYQQGESTSRDELDQGLEQAKGPAAQTQEPPCSDCGGEMRYIEEYDSWYCDKCKEYK